MTFGDAAIGGYSRSPYGERGLKFDGFFGGAGGREVALLTESVD